MIIGITGLTQDEQGRRSIAGSGKDTVASWLVENRHFVSVALADPMKRFCREIFGFTDEQLWGPSEARNKPDERYKRPLSSWNEAVVKALQVPREYVITPEMSHLTPRYALQRLGTEWGRDCYPDLWVDLCLCAIRKVLHTPGVMYTPAEGVVGTTEITSLGEWERDDAPKEPYRGAVIPDVRFINEFNRIKEAGGKVWRVKRQIESIPGELGEGHLSERELLELSDENFDQVIDNNGSIADLCQTLCSLEEKEEKE